MPHSIQSRCSGERHIVGRAHGARGGVGDIGGGQETEISCGKVLRQFLVSPCKLCEQREPAETQAHLRHLVEPLQRQQRSLEVFAGAAMSKLTLQFYSTYSVCAQVGMVIRPFVRVAHSFVQLSHYLFSVRTSGSGDRTACSSSPQSCVVVAFLNLSAHKWVR